MDYRYETKDEARDFHKRRKAFVVVDDKVYYLSNNGESHWEFCQKMNIKKEIFNELIRGFYLDGDLVIYKNNFSYDAKLVEDAQKYITKIKDDLGVSKMKVYFGMIIPEECSDKKNSIWDKDYYYGEIDENNHLIK